jgi:hypothetical protein
MQTKNYFDDVNVVDGVVFVREVIEQYDEEKLISRSFLRRGIAPGEDIAELPADIQSICNEAWTDEVVQNFKSKILKGN